jgi:uncharacterized membrane protein
MTRFILAVFAIFSGLGLIFSLLSSISQRTDGLTQTILGLAVGITALIFIISLGMFSLLDQSQKQNMRIETALKDIALSNSDAAKSVQAVLALLDAPARAQREADAAAAKEEQRVRLAAYRSELQA